MKKFMERIKKDEKICIGGTVDNKNIRIKDKRICDIIKYFYKALEKENIDIDKVKTIKTTKLMIQNKNINRNTLISIFGYARRKGKADKTNMRHYFNIQFMKVSSLLLELQSLNENYLRLYGVTNKDFDIIIDYFYIEKKKGKNENE